MMHDRDYQGNYKISNFDKLSLSTCVFLISILAFISLYMLYIFVF